MDASRTIRIECLRYDPETDAAPRYQAYDVPFTDDMSVLQGLQYIKDHVDGSLTFRWSCRMAVCGSCGMMLNGTPSLSCETFLRDFHPAGLRVEPLTHFPIVRDLDRPERFPPQARDGEALHHPARFENTRGRHAPADALAQGREH